MGTAPGLNLIMYPPEGARRSTRWIGARGVGIAKEEEGSKAVSARRRRDVNIDQGKERE